MNADPAAAAVAEIRAYAQGAMPDEYCGKCIAKHILRILDKYGLNHE